MYLDFRDWNKNVFNKLVTYFFKQNNLVHPFFFLWSHLFRTEAIISLHSFLSFNNPCELLAISPWEWEWFPVVLEFRVVVFGDILTPTPTERDTRRSNLKWDPTRTTWARYKNPSSSFGTSPFKGTSDAK